MIGLILSGGESKRMGADKGLLTNQNQNWVKIALDKLSGFLPKVLVSVNPAQVQSYQQSIDKNLLIADDSKLQVKGPLHGLLSAHLQSPSEDIFVLACDMVKMETFVLEELLNHFEKNPAYDCYVYRNEHGTQPLAGIYTAQFLQKIILEVQEGSLTKFSMKHLLDSANVYLLDVPVESNESFINYNYKSDVDFQ